KQLGVHGDDRPGLEPEGVVGVDAAGAAGSLSGKASDGETLGAPVGIQDLRERLRAPALPDRPYQPEAGLSLAGLESEPADLLPLGERVAVLRRAAAKSESGCSDPPMAPRAAPQKRA